MKPNTEDATCPKCRTKWHAQGAKVTYYAAGEEMSTTETVEGHRLVTTYHAPWVLIPEHLRCACERCGYEWLMECADAKSTTEQLKGDKLNPVPTVIDVCCPGCRASISYWLHDGEPSLREWSMHGEFNHKP